MLVWKSAGRPWERRKCDRKRAGKIKEQSGKGGMSKLGDGRLAPRLWLLVCHPVGRE